MKDRVEIIARTERRRKYSDAEKAAILAEADQEGVSVRQVAERHEIAESLIYNWRSARRQAAAIASEPLEFIPYGAIVMAEPSAPRAASEPRKPQPPTSPPMTSAPEELVRPHPGARPGVIDIGLPPVADLCPRGRGDQPVDHGRLARPGKLAAATAG